MDLMKVLRRYIDHRVILFQLAISDLLQLMERPSSQELLKAVLSLFQDGGPSSFTQLMSSVSGLFCGYPEGGGSRVLSFNWYEDNNYKVFLGVNATKNRNYVYDDTTSKWRGVELYVQGSIQ